MLPGLTGLWTCLQGAVATVVAASAGWLGPRAFDWRTRVIVAAAVLLLVDPGLIATAQNRRPVGRPARDITLYVSQYRDLKNKLQSELETLAKYCDEHDFADDAQKIRQITVPDDPRELRIRTLPSTVQPELPGDLPAEERYWRTQLKYHTASTAKQLYLLSRQALNAGHVALAYELVHETARLDPDHSPARKILGFVRLGSEWVSPFAASMLRKGRVWNKTYGWLPKDHVDRYKRGERFYNNGWISAAKEAEFRRDFSRAWEVRTDHYRIRTNHSLERGVEIATKLEDFHALFFQILAGFFNTQEQARQLFEGTSRGVPVPEPLDVFYFKTRDEYIAFLKTKTDQQVEITNGMFFPSTGIAYFFDDPEAVDPDSTIYHEATHQLLSGQRPQVDQVGLKSDFWVIEGIACYMESFHRDGERFSVGDPQHKRLISAQENLLQENYYVPLRQLAAMGMNDYQRSKNIRKNYSQSAAQTHFFMHYEDGKYREALVEYLSQIYSTRALKVPPSPLSELTGIDSDELDRQYRSYLAELNTMPVASE